MQWQIKLEENGKKSGDFTAFVTELALFYEKRYPGDGSFFELAAILCALPPEKQTERYAKRAMRHCRVAVQRAAAKRRKYEIFTADKPVPVSLTAEDLIDLSGAVKALTDYEKMLLHMRFFAGYSAAEIADRVGISRQAVSRRIAKTLDKLRGLL